MSSNKFRYFSIIILFPLAGLTLIYISSVICWMLASAGGREVSIAAFVSVLSFNVIACVFFFIAGKYLGQGGVGAKKSAI